MPIHDWSRVGDNEFHDFHNRWIARITEWLNDGGLSSNYLARCEQKYGTPIADILTLSIPQPENGVSNGWHPAPGPSVNGGVAVAVNPRIRQASILPAPGYRTRSIVIRQAANERPVAILEVVSRSNKDGPEKRNSFVTKVNATLDTGIHVVLLDLLPPNEHTPGGLHACIAEQRGGPLEPDADDWQPTATPIALLSYVADRPDVRVYYDFIAPGDELTELPLFLTPEQFVNLPLAPTYAATFRGTAFTTRQRLDAA